jgi:hypothetical protein
VLAVLSGDPAAELHQDASARSREHLDLRSCSILGWAFARMSCYQDRAGSHDERARANHRERPVLKTLRCGSAADRRLGIKL